MNGPAAVSIRPLLVATALAMLFLLSSLIVPILPDNEGSLALEPAQDQATRAGGHNNLNQFRGENNNTGVCTEKYLLEVKSYYWRFETQGPIDSSAVVVDFKVYFGSKDKNVYCIDADNKENIWNYTTGNTVSGTPLVSEGCVYIGSNDRNLYCLDSNDGSKIWNRTLGAGISSSCKEYQNRIYLGCDDGNVYCFEKNGTKAWNFSLSSRRTEMWSTPAISDGLLYIGAKTGRMVCLDAKTGEFMFDIITGDIYSTVCVAYGNILFTNGLGNKLLSYNGKTGLKNWEFSTPIGEDGNTYTSVAVHNGTVFFSDYKWVYCLPLNDTNGDRILSNSDVIWKYPIENYQGGSSPLIVAGRVYIGTYVSILCLFENNGTKDWEYVTDNIIVSSPVFVNGYLFIGCYDNFMYCFKGTPLNDTETPPPEVPTDDEPLNLYPTITIPLGVFVIADIALLVIILVVWRKGRTRGTPGQTAGSEVRPKKGGN